MSALIDAEIEAIKRKSLQKKNEKASKDKEIPLHSRDDSEKRSKADMNGNGRASQSGSISKRVDNNEYEDRSRSKVQCV